MTKRNKLLRLPLLLWSVVGVVVAVMVGNVRADWDKHRGVDYWQMTRTATVVVVGTVTSVDTSVTMSVTGVLKGEAGTTQVAFDRPPATRTPPHREHVPFEPTFTVGDSWLVFLDAKATPAYTLQFAVRGADDMVVQAVNDVLELDILTGDAEKCQRLVQLICLPVGLSRGYAVRELLAKHNRPENFDLLAPLGVCPSARDAFVALLAENPNPTATERLRQLLRTERGNLLLAVITGLQRKSQADVVLSEELLSLVTDPDPRVRGHILFALNCRDYRPAFPAVAKCLDDPDPEVQATALTWPWYEYLRAHQEALPKLRTLSRDRDVRVRANACSALIGVRDVGSFYYLWWHSIFDSSQWVRHAIHLDLLLESRPAATTLILIWPTILVLAVGTWRARLEHSGRMVLTAVSSGYLAGVISGLVIGTTRATNPFIYSLVLMPAVCTPVVLALLIRKVPPRLRVTENHSGAG